MDGVNSADSTDRATGILGRGPAVSNLLISLLPDRWTRNLLVFAAIPFPLYGIFRYLYLVHRPHGGGSPSDLLLGHRPMLVCVTLWVVTTVLIIYA